MNYGRVGEQKKRSMETSSNDNVKKKVKRDAFIPKGRKGESARGFQGRCVEFSRRGTCKFWDYCKFNHITNDGVVVMRANAKGKRSSKIWKTKGQLLEQRSIDSTGPTHIGTVVKWRAKNGYGFISTNEEIAWKGVIGKDRIYVMKQDIICTSSEVGLNVGSEVRFKVYTANKGLGAAQVKNADGSPIAYQGNDANVHQTALMLRKRKPAINKQKSSKKDKKKKELESSNKQMSSKKLAKTKETKSYPKLSTPKKKVRKKTYAKRAWRPLQY